MVGCNLGLLRAIVANEGTKFKAIADQVAEMGVVLEKEIKCRSKERCGRVYQGRFGVVEHLKAGSGIGSSRRREACVGGSKTVE